MICSVFLNLSKRNLSRKTKVHTTVLMAATGMSLKESAKVSRLGALRDLAARTAS